MKNTIKDDVILTFLTSALDNRYLKSIREEKGGTYGVGVGGSLMIKPVEHYLVRIQFDTNEQMADELSQIIVDEIEKIAKEGPLAEDMDKTREFLLKDYKKLLEQNVWWLQAIDSYYRYGLDNVNDYEAAVNGVTAADVQALAKRLLEDKNMIKVVMRPEK
jgi:zinc protease